MTTFLVKKFRMQVAWQGTPFRENTYLIYEEETKLGLLIDPGNRSAELDTFIETAQVKVVGILNTHGHFDHSDGNGFYRQRFLVDVFGHSRDRARYTADAHLPTQYIDELETVEIDTFRVKILRTPGHTPGGVCYLIGTNLFTGDTLFRGTVGKTWDDDQGTAAENAQTMILAIKSQLLTLPSSTLVYPGHGRDSTIGSELQSNPFLCTNIL